MKSKNIISFYLKKKQLDQNWSLKTNITLTDLWPGLKLD